MNKLMLFPLTILALFSIFAYLYSTFSGDVDSSIQTPDWTEGEIDELTTYEVDLWQVGLAIGLLAIAVSVGILTGISAFTIDISDYSQELIVDMIMFGGIWSSMTVLTLDYFFANTFMTVLYILLTLLFVIGMGFHITEASDTA